ANRRTMPPTMTIWEFTKDGVATENKRVVANWTAVSSSRGIRVTLLNSDDPPVLLRVTSTKRPLIGTRTVRGDSWKWELTRLAVVGVWLHRDVYRSSSSGTTSTRSEDRLTLYTSGRINDPLRGTNWAMKGNQLRMSLNNGREVLAVIAPNGKSYLGQTTRRSVSSSGSSYTYTYEARGVLAPKETAGNSPFGNNNNGNRNGTSPRPSGENGNSPRPSSGSSSSRSSRPGENGNSPRPSSGTSSSRSSRPGEGENPRSPR
ncbi:MAG: hypothetical protein N2C14_23910, partial [Planctomycetales bacterium]